MKRTGRRLYFEHVNTPDYFIPYFVRILIQNLKNKNNNQKRCLFVPCAKVKEF